MPMHVLSMTNPSGCPYNTSYIRMLGTPDEISVRLVTCKHFIPGLVIAIACTASAQTKVSVVPSVPPNMTADLCSTSAPSEPVLE
jgi:hypothetical protein